MPTPFHSRSDWGARPARYETHRYLGEDTAHYGGPSPWGSNVDRSSAARFYATADHNRCATIWRAYQAFHLDSRGWADIAYSSGVCPHGHRYEGRGPDVRTAAQGTTAGNNASHATCYIAGAGDPLTDQAKAAFADESRRLRGLRKGHRDWKSTACPGDPLYRWVHSGLSVPSSPSPTPAPAPVPSSKVTVIKRGSSGPAVAKWQRRMASEMVRKITVDGDFGPNTERHTRDFQKWARIAVDGVVGRQSYDTMTRWEGRSCSGLVRGVRSNKVALWQSRLNKYAGADLVCDGAYGPATTAATASFQKFFKLGTTGLVVGTKTNGMMHYIIASRR